MGLYAPFSRLLNTTDTEEKVMEILEKKTDEELLRSLLGEIAKSRNELCCSLGDIQKAQSRLGFLLVIANELLVRFDLQKDDYK